MPVERRESVAKEDSGLGTGIYLAKVISHLDPSFMGGLEVTLLRGDGNTIGESTQNYNVKYASPFFGSTAFEFMGYNVSDFEDTQKSYGMWFQPPDVGVTVICAFVDGRADQGYWFGCVPSRFANHMVPGIAATDVPEFAEGDEEKYDVTSIPSGEINRRANDLGESMAIEKVPRAVHPFADHLLEEGLLEDDVRGITSSSARRNAPSNVYGISTPGPLNREEGAKKQFIGASESTSQTPVPVSRLGGTQFVMDDGDDRYQRKTTASEGPPEYANVLEGETGEPNIPKDEYTRIRTRTGHQILMHNSEDLIYVANSRGTAWIELTSDGKMDIFCEDSISVHTKQDFNFRADRDINMEAGRDVNINAQGGSFRAEAGINYNLYANAGGFLTALGATNILSGVAILQTAARIHLNGPPALPVIPLSKHPNPVVDPSAVEWKSTRYQSEETLDSILKRIPQHEPWSLHEHLDPLACKPDKTDRSA